MSKNKFIELLQRNFSENELVCVGVLTKYVNQRKGGNPFARDMEVSYIPVSEIPEFAKFSMYRGEAYICFNPLTKTERKKPNAKDTYIIAQDIDGADIPKDLTPSYYWETSPKKFQGVWIMDNLLTPEEHEMACRKLIAKYGFDKTSADIVHYYRIPKTINHKYKTDFKVGGLQGSGKVYRKSEFLKALGKVKTNVSTGAVPTDKIPLVNYDLDEVAERYEVIEFFTKSVAGVDRSALSFELLSKLHKRGANKEVAKFIILNLPDEVSKFTTETVDSEIHRVYAKLEGSKDKRTTNVAGGIKMTGKKEILNSAWGKLTLTKLADIQEASNENKWLIEDIWAMSSVGIIGAPPKSFKSTLVTNLVLSVASGKDFCGKKVKQGGVIMVQGESNSSQEKAKMKGIYGEGVDDLPIYFLNESLDLTEINDLEELITENDIRLLVLDPMYMLLGEDLNKQKEVTQALKLITLLRDKTDCAIMLVHHSKKIERGQRISPNDLFGTTFINGWYESLILLQRNSAVTSELKTFFRDSVSGTRYTLHINPDNMKAKIHLLKDENEWDNSAHFPKMSSKKEGNDE